MIYLQCSKFNYCLFELELELLTCLDKSLPVLTQLRVLFVSMDPERDTENMGSVPDPVFLAAVKAACAEETR